MRRIKFLVIVVAFLLLAFSCAKRGTITGGDKDITPPKITSSSPKNLTTNFNQNTFKITFDEYIKLKDVQKQLIVSPPLKYPVTVLPQAGTNKYIVVKIADTLQANTTYSFNFGQSIQDNNEGNAYPQLKYVFSTGNNIDSLSIEGTIKDSYEKKTDNFVNIMLYEMDEKYNDSTIFKQTPRYVTNTLDTLKSFKLENIKAGKYKLVALKEATTNYKFDPNKDKIAFYNQEINVPDKAIFELELFKETSVFKTKKPSQASGNRIILGYEGNIENLKIKASQNKINLETKVTKMVDKDSVQIWFNNIKNDSILLDIENEKYQKSYTQFIKNQKKDTLNLINKKGEVLRLFENGVINSSIPLLKFDEKKMLLTKKDSSKVNFKLNYNDYEQNLEVIFEKNEDENYTLQLLPEAVEDYLGHKNDSLKFKFSTKLLSDYGTLKLNLQNVKSFPVIVELTDDDGKILESKYSESNSTIEFLSLEPRKYAVRVIYDSNKNKVRDTGNYLQNLQPEEVVHFPNVLDVRANWDVEQAFDLTK